MKAQIRTVVKGDIVVLAEEHGPYDILIETRFGLFSITEDTDCRIRLTCLRGTVSFLPSARNQTFVLSNEFPTQGKGDDNEPT